MTLGEIKIAAIKLMYDNLGEQIRVSDIKRLEDDNTYGLRLVNMLEPINRAIDRAVVRRKLPLASLDLADYITASGRWHTRYDLSTIRDYHAIYSVVYEDSTTYEGHVAYRMEGANTLVLPTVAATDGAYTLVYYSKPRKVDEDTDNEDELKIPESIARLIPYFVKAELYEEDEPNAAAAARDIFERGLDAISVEPEEFTAPLKVVYSIG